MPPVESISGIRGIYDNGPNEKVAAKYAYSYISLLHAEAMGVRNRNFRAHQEPDPFFLLNNLNTPNLGN